MPSAKYAERKRDMIQLEREDVGHLGLCPLGMRGGRASGGWKEE